ncbi:hypothetical protein AMELA_G00278840 [Ameiurus melas]|uniref:Uncharacterized protein n=1 Tax=Ameiurus melas TaxID=219545 RepID=A0A7J5ZKA8_AMEME|nr:hypothetical protein AMELA_G00278840 [Ameiurus melas]
MITRDLSINRLILQIYIIWPKFLDTWTSVPDLTVVELTNPYSHAPKFSGRPSQKSRGYDCKRGLTLEWDGQQAHMGVMVRCPQTIGHVVYVLSDNEVMETVEIRRLIMEVNNRRFKIVSYLSIYI